MTDNRLPPPPAEHNRCSIPIYDKPYPASPQVGYAIEWWWQDGCWHAQTEHRCVKVTAASRYAACLLAAAAYDLWCFDAESPIPGAVAVRSKTKDPT